MKTGLNFSFLGQRKRRSVINVPFSPLVSKTTFSPVSKKCRVSHEEADQNLNGVTVGYIFSQELLSQSNRIPRVVGRSLQVHELIKSYRLPSLMKTITSKQATEDDLKSFHSGEYIEYVKSIQSRKAPGDDGILDTSITGEDFGLSCDCIPFPDMISFMKEIAGSTLTAVKAVLEGTCKIALNFHGGWHHSKALEASGFCYVNDIVIGILYALKQRDVDRVLYLDFDLHHGDAVQDAFFHSSRVMTVSFHKYELGFFPGTGGIEEIGVGRGKGYSVNVPLKDCITDEKYQEITRRVLTEVFNAFKPNLIVAQFGADGIANDPMESFNLTPDSLVKCLRQLKSWRKPLVILGGGGYNLTNTAKTWTRLTASAIGVQLPTDIPDSDPFFLKYGPSFEITVDAGFPRDRNDEEYLKGVYRTIKENLAVVRSNNQSSVALLGNGNQEVSQVNL